jgi:hypothetical protein
LHVLYDFENSNSVRGLWHNIYICTLSLGSGGQASHTEGVNWYDCSSPHSEAVNTNMKAYAAWWLWARLAGWDGR